MASLTLSIGAYSSEVTASNAKALKVLTNYAASIDATGTDQEKLDAVVASLRAYMNMKSKAYVNSEAVSDASSLVDADETIRFED